MWHVSIARMSNSGPVSLDRWGGGTFRDALRRALHALGEVGTGQTVDYRGRIAFHVRRSLSDSEMATLDPAWLALPAQDEFCETGEMEQRL